MIQDSGLPDTGPVDTLLQLSAGAVLPRCLHAVAELGVADALNDDPQTAAALATATGAHAEALARALRLLAAHGVFELRDGLIHHNAASRLLRTHHPQSMRAMVRMFGLSAFWTVIGDLQQAIVTGEPIADKALSGGVWGFFAENRDAGRIFDEAMTAKSHGQVAGVVASYDFSGARVIGDIGGGRGHLVQAILANAPGARGVLFDQPHVIERVAASASDRLTLQAGDFFSDDLPVCDVYLLMEVIHDWDEERAMQILRRIRSAAPGGARVLLIEAIVPEAPDPSWPKTLDLWMLMISGKQRTRQEYGTLLASAGFRFSREIDTHAGVSILEGVRD